MKEKLIKNELIEIVQRVINVEETEEELHELIFSGRGKKRVII